MIMEKLDFPKVSMLMWQVVCEFSFCGREGYVRLLAKLEPPLVEYQIKLVFPVMSSQYQM